MNETDRETYLHPRLKRRKLSNRAKFRDFEIQDLMEHFEQPENEMDLSEFLTKAELSALDKTGNLRYAKHIRQIKSMFFRFHPSEYLESQIRFFPPDAEPHSCHITTVEN